MPQHWGLHLLGVVPKSSVMSPESHCDPRDIPPYEAWGSPAGPQCCPRAWGTDVCWWGDEGPPSCGLPDEGTERICRTEIVTGPGPLVPTCCTPTLGLLLPRGQELLSCLPDSCLHVSQRAVAALPGEREHREAPLLSPVCPRTVAGRRGSTSTAPRQSRHLFGAWLPQLCGFLQVASPGQVVSFASLSLAARDGVGGGHGTTGRLFPCGQHQPGAPGRATG